jgi:hypothetical protein
MWAAIGTAIAFAFAIWKYVTSGDAAKAAAEAQFQKDEKARQDAQNAAVAAAQSQAAHDSAGTAAADDAADALMRG